MQNTLYLRQVLEIRIGDHIWVKDPVYHVTKAMSVFIHSILAQKKDSKRFLLCQISINNIF